MSGIALTIQADDLQAIRDSVEATPANMNTPNESKRVVLTMGPGL